MLNHELYSTTSLLKWKMTHSGGRDDGRDGDGDGAGDGAGVGVGVDEMMAR